MPLALCRRYYTAVLGKGPCQGADLASKKAAAVRENGKLPPKPGCRRPRTAEERELLMKAAPGEIRTRCLDNLRALRRTVARLECLYSEFPDAPADSWRSAIKEVADRIKGMTDAAIRDPVTLP